MLKISGLVFFLLVYGVGWLEAARCEKNFLSGMTPDQGATAYNTYMKSSKNEEKKIEYLIMLIRYADVKFVRNDETYTGEQAALFLNKKRVKHRKDYSDAVGFVQNIASYSNATGQPYVIVYSHKKKCPAGEVLKNELNKLLMDQ